MVGPALHLKYLEAMMSRVFTPSAVQLATKLEQHADKKKPVDLEECFSQMTLDVIGKAVFNYGAPFRSPLSFLSLVPLSRSLVPLPLSSLLLPSLILSLLSLILPFPSLVPCLTPDDGHGQSLRTARDRRPCCVRTLKRLTFYHDAPVPLAHADFQSLTKDSPVIQAVYTALKETENRSTDLIPYWKYPALVELSKLISPRQTKAQEVSHAA